MRTGIKLTILLLSVMLMSSCISLKKRFFDEAGRQIGHGGYVSEGKITEADISGLPEPVQRYFRYCGYIGEEKMNNAFITWQDVYLKMSPAKKWTKLTCYQFNKVSIPVRMDYMKSRMMGLFPFEGSHMYHDGYGSMKIVLMKLFAVVDAKGMEFDQSELVTILSETLFVPSYALQPYISWQAINDSCAKATLRYDDREVSGTFFFNAEGACTRFDTDDRYFDNGDGTYKRIKWSAVVDDYQVKNGVKYASHIKAVWHTDKGDFEYFKGRVADIEFNVPDSDYLKYYR